MSKQDIEKRLGFAAQGVKAEMAHIPGITGEAYEPNPQGTHRYKVGDQVKDKRHPSFQGTIKRLMRDKYGYPSYVVYTQGGGPQDAQDSDLVLASRPGVKIKFSAQFEVGRVYEHSFIGDYDAIVQWKVLSRTESTLTIKKVGEGNRNSATTPTRGEEKRVKINSDAQGEFVYPMGKFSMAPILRASKTTASRPGVKAKFADAALERIRKNATISNKILTLVSKGMPVPEAVDSVLGEGTYKRLASDVYDELKKPNTKKASTDFDLAEACWEGYEAVGTKKKDGKTVPNCVPKKKASRSGVKATFAEFNVGDKVVATPNNHIDAYGRIIKIENGIATIASAEGNVKAKLSDLELVKKGSVEDLRRLGMKGFARPGVKAEFYASPEHLPMILAKTRKMHEDSKKAAEKYLQSGSVANQGGAAGLANSMVNSLERDLKNDLYRLTQSRNPVHKKAAKEAYAEIKAMADWWYSQYKKWTAARPGVKAKMETPMRVALTPMHTRAEQGYENFIANLMKLGGITREQAQKAFKAFKDAKVLVTKEQYRGGGITVKHGAFMERDVIRRAAGLPEESSRPGSKAKA